MLLESFRHDPVGLPIFALTKNPSKSSVQATYIDYSFRAFYLTMQDIEQLELSSGELVPDGRNSIVAVTLWFLSIESYINTILKLTCLHVNKDFNDYKSKKISEKLSSLLELLEIDSLPIKKAGVYNRLHEFTIFRNEIFHDRHLGHQVQFNKTQFSEVPVNCNLADVMQGLLIFLEIISLLRYCVTGLDVMPDIFLHVNQKAFTKKLDLLYQTLIKPSFEQVLAKHELATNLNLNFMHIESLSSTVFSKGDAKAIIISDSPSEYYYKLSAIQTSICRDLLGKIVDAEKISPKHFQLGKYII